MRHPLPILGSLVLVAAPGARAQQPSPGVAGGGAPGTAGTSLSLGDLGDAHPPSAGASAGGAPAVQVRPVWIPGAGPPSAYVVALSDPLGDGFDEVFMVQVPPKVKFGKNPMLVFFHKFSTTAQDLVAGTTYLEECQIRDWFCVAPLGGSDVNFGSDVGQAHTELVLEWMIEAFGDFIDRDRIYGVGFSMGGGWMVNYAARHLDPTEPTFAALVNHTGGVALKDTYTNDPGVQSILEFWFGGSPAQAGFEYLRASSIDFDPQTLAVNPTSDQAGNLAHVPIYNFYNTFDPISYLPVQMETFHDHMVSLGAPSELHTVTTFGHAWGTLNETTACDWLSDKVLTLPSAGSVLADGERVYFDFDVEVTTVLRFGAFDFDVDAGANAVAVSATDNIHALTYATVQSGLDPTQPLTVSLSSLESNGDLFRLRDYAAAPASVLRDGVPTALWSHDLLTGVLELDEPADPGTHVWEIFP